MKVIAYNHTHWDREWYEPFQTFRLRFIEVMDLILQEILNENIDCFYLDGQTVILEDYFEIHPEKKLIIQDLIRQNKIIIGPWYVLADEFLVSGESLFRNMLIGITQAKELGCKRFLGYLPDSFGHNSEIPRILAAFDIKNSVLWRGAGSEKSEFIWESGDNSSVIATYLIEGYFQNILHYNISIEEKAEKLKEFLDKIKEYSSSEYILLPVGGDHLGSVVDFKRQIKEIGEILNRHCERPTEADYEQSLRGGLCPHLTPFNASNQAAQQSKTNEGFWIASSQASRNDNAYFFKEGGIFEYIDKINNNPPLNKIKGELRDNSRNPILSGTLSTRLYLKQSNALCTWKLSKLAEPFYAFLQNLKLVSEANNELEYAWKLLLKNHPHDSICGCSTNEVHDEMMPRFAQVNQISDRLILRAQNAISSQVSKDSVWVYNGSDYEFSGIARIKTKDPLPDNLKKQFIKSTKEFPKEILLDTQRPPFSEDMTEFSEYLVYVENIKSHSIKVIDDNFQYQNNPDEVEIADNFIKNSNIRIDVNPDGTLKLTDFKINREFNNLHYFYDRKDNGDTYNYAPVEGDCPVKSELIKTEIIEKGLLRSVLRVYYQISKTTVITDISITSCSNRAEFLTSWENKSENHILQIKFPLSEQIKETYAENTFGIIKREHEQDYSVGKLIPCAKGIEIKTNTAPMQRFVFSQGLAIITEGLAEYGVDDDELYITILRAVGKLSKLSLNTRNFPAGPPLDTTGSQCLGRHSIRYAICAKENSIELFKEADEFMGSIITDVGNATQLTSLTTQLFQFNNPNIYTYATKLPLNIEISGIILRLMNLSGENQSVCFESDIMFSHYCLVNGLEENISEPAGFEKTLEVKPYELKSVYLFNK